MLDVDTPTVLAELETFLGDRLSSSSAVRDQHGRDESYHAPASPDGVAFARSTDEVARILRVCHARRVPVIPFGAGSSLEGGIPALTGGISLDLSQMDAVLDVRPQDLDVTVQAGVTRQQLDQHIGRDGLFFPVDPGAHATLGGMAATRASGTNAVRYGTMRDNVLGLTVVLADGRVVRTGGRARKSAAGYDLTRLFVGSEGTLGVITELTLRVYGIPEAVAGATCHFPSVGTAVDATVTMIQLGMAVARVELLSAAQVKAIVDYSGLEGLDVADTLFIEFHGTTQGSVQEARDQAQEVCEGHGGHGFRGVAGHEDLHAMWEARHLATYANKATRPGSAIVASDVCVPISELSQAVALAEEHARSLDLHAFIVGHVGDGNFHVGYVVDPKDADELSRVDEHHSDMVRRAIAVGGTCTGEHGIGTGKRDFLVEEVGGAIDVMASIKRALDPRNILNPGKVLHPERIASVRDPDR